MNEPAGATRKGIKFHLAASVVAAMIGVLALTACETAVPRTTDISARHDSRQVHHVNGDYSTFRYSHHGTGAHGLRGHLHRWHRFH